MRAQFKITVFVKELAAGIPTAFLKILVYRKRASDG